MVQARYSSREIQALLILKLLFLSVNVVYINQACRFMGGLTGGRGDRVPLSAPPAGDSALGAMLRQGQQMALVFHP